MELEIGELVSDVDLEDYDDKLLNLVAGNPIHMFKFAKRAAIMLPELAKSLSKLEGMHLIETIKCV